MNNPEIWNKLRQIRQQMPCSLKRISKWETSVYPDKFYIEYTDGTSVITIPLSIECKFPSVQIESNNDDLAQEIIKLFPGRELRKENCFTNYKSYNIIDFPSEFPVMVIKRTIYTFIK